MRRPVGIDYPELKPRLFSFNSPLGACPACEGFGNVMDIDMELVVPDPTRSIRDGAIAPWNTPAYHHELEELIALADDHDLPLDAPFERLRRSQTGLIINGVPDRNFGGLNGFFAWLERRKYKMHLRVFLSRWRSYHPCPACGGTRLRPRHFAVRIGGRNIAEVSQMKIADARRLIGKLDSAGLGAAPGGDLMLDQIASPLTYLEDVGLGYFDTRPHAANAQRR